MKTHSVRVTMVLDLWILHVPLMAGFIVVLAIQDMFYPALGKKAEIKIFCCSGKGVAKNASNTVEKFYIILIIRFAHFAQPLFYQVQFVGPNVLRIHLNPNPSANKTAAKNASISIF